MTATTPLVFGLGTGRCGTLSLAHLLGVSHEMQLLPWEPEPKLLDALWPRVVRAGGDVSLSWLGYVPEILARDPEARFVCLQRERAATVRSWLRQLRGRDQFFMPMTWKDAVTGEAHVRNVFPALDGPIPEAVDRYYTLYYERAAEWARRFPHRFRIFPMESVLNRRAAQRVMLRFAGRPWPGFRRFHTHKPALESWNRMQSKLIDVVRESFTPGMPWAEFRAVLAANTELQEYVQRHMDERRSEGVA